MTDDIQRSLGRIEGKLDTFITAYSSTQKEHGDDIEELKSFKNKALGIVALVSGIVGAFSSQIASWFKSA